MDVPRPEDYLEGMLSRAKKLWGNPAAMLKKLGIRKSMAVADLGCGPGFFTIPIAGIVGSKGLVCAVDSNPMAIGMLTEAVHSSHATRIKIVKRDVCSTGLDSSSIDIAFFSNVFHDIKNKASFLKEVHRILKPGGAAIDLDWDKVRRPTGPPIEITVSKRDAIRMLSKGGFSKIDIMDIGRYHYCLICRS